MSDYDYEDASEDDEWSEDEEEQQDDDPNVLIENTFYEADDIKKREPQLALEKFLEVLSLESEKEPREQEYYFKALKNVVILYSVLKKYPEMLKYQVQLLGLMDSVARNDAIDAINAIIDAAGKVEDPDQAMKIFELTLEKLASGNNERLWFNTSTKLSKIYLEKGDVENGEKMVQQLLASCRHKDGTDDHSKAQQLLEAYAFEIQLCSLLNDDKRIKIIYPKTESLQADIADPKITSIIKEAGSKIYMSEKDWPRALSEFFESFKCYQEAGNNVRAKAVLKYVVLAGILANSDINPFHSQEANVYKNDSEILAMMRLRTAYEQNDINELQSILGDKNFHILDDPFIAGYLDELLRSVRLNMLVGKIKPYKSVRIDFLARELNINSIDVMSLLVELILDGKINGVIDQIKGVLELAGEQNTEVMTRRHKAMQKWTNCLRAIHGSLLDKVKG